MGLGDGPDGRLPVSPNMFQKSPLGSVELDSAAQAKQRRLIEDGLARVAAAREQIASTPAHGLSDDAATTSLEALLDEIMSKQNALADEQQALGIGTPHTPEIASPFGASKLLAKTPAAERRQYFEQALANMEQSLFQMRENLNNHADIAIAVPSSESAEQSDDESAELDDVTTEMDDSDGGPMSPRGIYMRRCAPLSPEEFEVEKETYKVYKRKSHIDFIGLALFLLFILATLFYAYTRITYSIKDLGPIMGYGAFILLLELMGAISIIFYGVWLIAVTDNRDIMPLDQDGPTLRRNYHIRVLIPCYKESLAIVRRTVIAARKAKRPPGCSVTIYLCDDGRKKEKRQWIKSLECDDVVYVTGRPKGKGKTTNGKSENLNYSLRLIYPKKPDPGEQPNIPLTELMCLFDADQTCSVSFFENLLRYIDSGDDVAVALSPQLMHNVLPDCDIFNHQNVHFWEKMQPGMDALGFISLTGTNMVLRSRALQSCDWFPTESVTEDWELGMRMKKLKWKCRYVPEYCAIGEAPEEVRNAFQQRSRWCKGHFQTFWSRQCPLIDSKLGIFYRFTYSSTCLSYISAGVSVPVMTLVPIVTLLFGYFPISLNFWTVVGISVYYIVLNMLTYYCWSFKHFTALWLSNIATTIMFWPFLKAAIFTPIKSCMGRGLTFKSTQKGSVMASASLKELGPSIVLVLLSLMALIAGFINFNINVNAPKAIALCWVVYNIIPHALLLIYAKFGQGSFLTWSCKFCMILSSFVGLLALVLLWLLYPRNMDYTKAAAQSIYYLDAQRSGVLPSPYVVPFRFTSGTANVYAGANSTVFGTTAVVSADLTGGFYNDGEVGPVKVTFNIALTTTMLAWSLLDFQTFWASDPVLRNAALDVLLAGVTYVRNCRLPDPYGVWENDRYVYLVGDIRQEIQEWNRPEDLTVQQNIYVADPALNQMLPSDLGGQFTATLVSSALVLRAYSPVTNAESAGSLISDAANVFNASANARDVYPVGTYLLQELKGGVNATTDSGILDYYPSTTFYDDLFWGATWLLRASRMGYLPQFTASYLNYAYTTMDLAYQELDTMSASYDYMNNVAVVHATVFTSDLKFHQAAQSFIWDWICSGNAKYTTFGRGYYYQSPLLGSTATVAALAATYSYNARKNANVPVLSDFLDGFYCFAEAQGRYMLGAGNRSPMQIGYSSKTFTKTWDRTSTCPTYPIPCDPSIVLANRNDYNRKSGALLWAPVFTDDIPNSRGGNQTVISLENNWGLPLLWPALKLKGTPYMRCLQGQGAFLPQPVCKHSRPLGSRLGPTTPNVASSDSLQGLYTTAQTPPVAPLLPVG